MSRLVRFGLGGFVVLGALLLALLAAPDDRPTLIAPHAGRMPAAELDRVLRAVDAETSSAQRAELEARGRVLFNDPDVTLPGESCGGCHTIGGAAPEIGTIVHPVEGIEGDFSGRRDPPALFGVGDTAPYGWAGDVPTLAGFVTNAVNFHFEAEHVTPENIAAITAYLETVEAPRSANDRGALSPAARRGEEIFVGKGGCIGCHGGPDFTDNSLHVLGVPLDPGENDCGANNPRGCPAGDPLTGAFNTPTLRNLADTAPYFHNGEFATLEEVVRFYNDSSAVSPLALTDEEMADLVEYLRSL